MPDLPDLPDLTKLYYYGKPNWKQRSLSGKSKMSVCNFQKPRTCWEVLKRRFAVFRRDVTEHWFPCKRGSTEVDIKTKRMKALLRKQRESRFIDPESLPAAVPRRLSAVGLPVQSGDRGTVPEILRTGSRRRERRRSDRYSTTSRCSNP